MGEKVFSVVLLSYNQEKLLYYGLESILKQDYPYIQLIISDDASESLSIKKLEDYIEKNKDENIIEYIIRVNETNLGIASNCDAALSCCSGEYVLFLDGDDVLANDSAITNIVKAFNDLPKEEMVVTGNALMCDENLENGSLRLTKKEVAQKNGMLPIEQFKELYLNIWPVPSATAYRKEVFSLLGGFRIQENKIAQDCYYFLHLTRNDIKINVIECVVAKHRAGGICYAEPNSVESIKFRKEMLRIAEREVFPNKDCFSMDELNMVCGRYYENMIGLLLASNEEYLISEPAYSLVADWADRNGVVWCYDKSNYDYNKHYEKHIIRKAFASIKERVEIFFNKKNTCRDI